MRKLLIFCMLLYGAQSYSQDLRGLVQGKNGNAVSPLPFANVYVADSNIVSLTDSSGNFSIHVTIGSRLVASYSGYQSDTQVYAGQERIVFTLLAENFLKEFVIEGEREATTISGLGAIKTEVLREKEFKKAACCNLSESFETNPTVEVTYSDAISGMKQIQMLGLSGKYSQILVENIPSVRGLTGPSGLNWIPGPWVKEVNLAKGAGSVVYGFESMTGQINIGIKNPEEGSKLFVNAYASSFGRTEANFISNKKLNKHWYTGLLLHANLTRNQADPNGDGFYNMPSGEGLNLMNRWRYEGKKWEAQFGFKVMDDSRVAGQKGYRKGMERTITNPYGVELRNQQYGVWGKMGKPAHEDRPWSIGFIASANRFESGFAAGINTYTGTQNNLYLSSLANRSFSDNKHVITVGASFMGDRYQEKFNQWNFDRTELVPGIFGEYTYNMAKTFTLVAGLRGDYHNLFGAFLSPRVHARYAVNSKLTLRASAGRGQRTANIFAENTGIFTSSRKLIIPDSTSPTYGLRPEIAWNYGINGLYEFRAFRRDATLTGDYYFVNFANQAVIDMDHSARELNVYNLAGLSYSHTAQVQLNLEPVKRLNVRLAYRYFDVRTTYGRVLREQSLLARNRGFVNLEYSTRNKWVFDVTAQFTGNKRLPDLIGNEAHLQLPATSPAYTIVHAQISKKWKKWDVYLGGENLLNVMQDRLILDPGNPFGEFFDASIVWAPAMGRMIYSGFRYEIE